jgi:hypothetical protein
MPETAQAATPEAQLRLTKAERLSVMIITRNWGVDRIKARLIVSLTDRLKLDDFVQGAQADPRDKTCQPYTLDRLHLQLLADRINEMFDSSSMPSDLSAAILSLEEKIRPELE